MDNDEEVQNWYASNDELSVGRSVEELATSQGIEPLQHIGDLAGGLPDDEDVDEMLDCIDRQRR